MRRAQLQSMETILVAIVLILILLFSIYFFSRVSDTNLEGTKQKFRFDEVQNTAYVLSALPELSCPLEGGEARICIDKIKLSILSQALNNPADNLYSDQLRLQYVELFGNTLITVRTVYPPPTPQEAQVILFNATSATNLLTQSLPVNIYNATTNSLELGVITVGLE